MVDKETREELQQLERKLDYEKKFVEFRNEEREEAEKGKTTADGEDEDDFYIPEGLIDIPDVELEDLTEEKLVEIVQKIVSVSDRNPNEGNCNVPTTLNSFQIPLCLSIFCTSQLISNPLFLLHNNALLYAITLS